MEALDLAFWNKSADVYACTHCGFLHWFLDPQVEERVPVKELEEPEREPQFRHLELVEERVPVEELEELIRVEESLPPDDLAEPTECLACHHGIPAGSAKCPSCGWSYG
jgi:hypothetical protein